MSWVGLELGVLAEFEAVGQPVISELLDQGALLDRVGQGAQVRKVAVRRSGLVIGGNIAK